MEPAVLAGPPAAVSGQEPLPGKVVEESAVRISPSPGGCTDPAQSLESPSRMAEQYRNWGGGLITTVNNLIFPSPVDSDSKVSPSAF